MSSPTQPEVTKAIRSHASDSKATPCAGSGPGTPRDQENPGSTLVNGTQSHTLEDGSGAQSGMGGGTGSMFRGCGRTSISTAGLALCIAVTELLASACSQGAGDGAVQNVPNKNLFIHDCWNGPFSLQPTFFGANPFSENEMAIRVQRGDDNEEVSDGLSVMVNDVQTIRTQDLNQPLNVGLPPGVSPPGIPLKLNPNPPLVSLTLYLHDTCHLQNGAIYSIDGTITFVNLFSGNENETNSDDRLTYAHFEDIRFADPRDMTTDYTISEDVSSHIMGWFKFYFQRGQPAQPFP